jgi:glucose/arabinose dehydrogenase
VSRRSTTALLALCALLSACSASESAAPSPFAPATAPPAPASSSAASLGAPQVLATGLEAPWGIDFLPGGDALLTERDTARVLRLPAAGGEPVEVTTLREAAPRGEGGLLGLAVSPRFAQDGLVYAYLTAAEDNRIVRFPLERPAEVEPVLTGIPKGTIHNGGRLAFGPDGNLYAGTGDTGDTSLAQDPGSLGGKVLRMTPEGEPVGGTLVFSRGHRNVQGLAFDDRGRLYAVEFGQNRFDEVNLLSEGSNGGWPEVEGAGDGGGRFLAPVTTWDTSEASPSGAAIVGGALYVAALRGERLWQVPLADPASPRALLDGQYGRLRAAARAPDGSLWVLTSNRDGRGDPVREDDRVLRLAAP